MNANPFSKIKSMASSFFETNTLKSVLSDAGMKKNLIIFDVGAYKGQTSSHFCKLFSHSLIHAFEPSPYLFAEAEKNLSNRKNIRCHNFALGEADEEAYLTRPDSDLCGKSSKPKKIIPQVF